MPGSRIAHINPFTIPKGVLSFFAFCWIQIVPSGPLFSQGVHPGDAWHHDPLQEHDSNVFVQVLWDSKYISEGRDNLDDGGMGSIAAEWTTANGDNEIVLGTWYAEAISDNYTELNLGAAYIIPFEKIQVTFGYTWLDFARSNESDNELSIEFGTSPIEGLDLTSAFVYSAEAEGTFVELIASRDIEQNEFTLTPFALLGINEGFVSDEHKGLNNLQLGIEASTPISDSMELSGYIAYSIALDKKPGESLEDIFWVGLRIGFGN